MRRAHSNTYATGKGLFPVVLVFFLVAHGHAAELTVPRDPAEAMNYLTNVAEGGNAEAQYQLGYRYEYPSWIHSPSGDRLPPPNMQEALRWYRRAVEQNYAASQHRLALCYLAGKGIERDEELGLDLMRKAADQGHLESMVELAKLYGAGVGKPRSESDFPIQIFERVVSHDVEGHWAPIVEAFDNLIVRSVSGVGRESDAVSAVQWHCKAALATVGLDRYSLREPRFLPGYRAESNNESRRDNFDRSLSRYLKAAKGDGVAAAQIGDAYLEGIYLPKSIANAWLWFSVAGQDGAIKDRLSRAESAMTAEELQKAKSRLPELEQLLYKIARQAKLQDGSRR